jgi:hypothetical protein
MAGYVDRMTEEKYIVSYRPVAKRRFCKQLPFLDNGSVNTFTLLGSKFLIMHKFDYNKGNGIFLRGPCRDVISKGQSQLLMSSKREALQRYLTA